MREGKGLTTPPSPKKLYTYIGAGRDGADFDFFLV